MPSLYKLKLAAMKKFRTGREWLKKKLNREMPEAQERKFVIVSKKSS
jgi:hypothetical protein